MAHDLLLAEELLLLSLHDEKGSDETWSGLDPGLAGALLLELTEIGALRVDGEGNLVAGGPRPDDPLLSEALDAVTSSERPRSVKHWVSTLPGKLKPLRRRLAERLVERGILGAERKALLGMTLSHRYPEKDPGLSPVDRDEVWRVIGPRRSGARRRSSRRCRCRRRSPSAIASRSSSTGRCGRPARRR